MIKVMLVEDDPMVAEFNRSYVSSVPGFKVISSVRTAQDALTFLETAQVDLILLDLYMPGMQGLALLSEIRSRGLHSDVILVTAASDTATIREAIRLGAIDYLIKPFEFDRLKKALLNYKARIRPLREEGSVNQTELDRLLGEKSLIPEPNLLPKGLDRSTLKAIFDVIINYPQNHFSADEIAGEVGISRVSVRKYLEFLTEIKSLTMYVNYGAVGRPVHRYELLPGFKTLIERYL